VLADLHDKEVEEINQLKVTLIDSAELATRASGLAALAVQISTPRIRLETCL
jgi:hypothetical protein